MKFESKIDAFFSSLGKDEFAHIINPFIANAQMLHTGTGTQEELVEFQHEDFSRDVYFEKLLGDFWFMKFNSSNNCYICCSSNIVASIIMAM